MAQTTEFAALFERLTQAFDQLPGIGPTAAQRLSRHIMQHRDTTDLAAAITAAQRDFSLCDQCRCYRHSSGCEVCDQSGEPGLLIIEQPDAVMAWREAGYNGHFFILHGLLSPMAGVSPTTLGLAMLRQRVEKLQPREVWLQLDSSAEGQATQQFIRELLSSTKIVSWAEQELLQQLQPAGGDN